MDEENETPLMQEEQMLSCLLLSREGDVSSHDTLSIARDRKVTENYFTDSNCRTLYRELLREEAMFPAFDPAVLEGHLRERKITFERFASAAAYLDYIIRLKPTSAHFEHYLDRVIDNHKKRLVLQKLDNFIYRVKNGQISAGCITRLESEILSNELLEIFDDEEVGESMEYSIRSAAEELGREFDEGIAADSGLKTGYEKLDVKLNGMQPAQLIVLAARPSVGKTALAVNIAYHLASENPMRRIGIISGEMRKKELIKRILIAAVRYDRNRIRYRQDLVMPTDRGFRICAIPARSSRMRTWCCCSDGRTNRSVRNVRRMNATSHIWKSPSIVTAKPAR